MFKWLRKKEKGLHAVDNRGWLRILEPFSGAWQKNIKVDKDNVLSYFAVFSCLSLISSDISKIPILLKRRDSNGIWKETSNKKISKILKKPNPIQNRIQFIENWILSKYSSGNAYILIVRDADGDPAQLRVLDPSRVTPLTTESGEVLYKLSPDNVSGLKQETIAAPASEIIHDRFNCLFHPLVGLSPIFACGLAATHGNKIQENSTLFFQNGGRPGGVLTIPGNISDDAARELKREWNTSYGGENAGKTAVLSDGMKYESFGISASDSQTVEQLKLSAQIVCAAFRVPEYKILGGNQTISNTEALDSNYYSQCLQHPIESIEMLLDEAFELSDDVGFELELKALLRMDTSKRYQSHSEAVKGSWKTIDEVRAEEDLPPVEGGDTPYLQQQNYSLAALAKRDAQDDPFTTKIQSQEQTEESHEITEETAKLMALLLHKELNFNEVK